MTPGNTNKDRYEAFDIVHSASGAAAALSDLEMKAEQEKRLVENVFPFEVFHEESKHFLTLIHEHMDIPRGFLGLSLLSSFSSAIGNAYVIKRAGGTMPLSMWSCLHGMTSSGKTVPINLCYKPLREIQQGFDRKYLEDKADMEEAKRKTHLEENQPRTSYNGMVSHLPSILVRDVHIATMLRTVLPDNPKGVTKEADEILEWINGMNKQNGQEGIDEQVYLSGWNGSDYRGIRSGRDQFVVPRVFINVIGGVQPDITYKLFKNDRDVTGFVFRMLFATAEPKIAIPDATWQMPEGVEETHRKCLHSLYKGLPVRDALDHPRELEMNRAAAMHIQEWKSEKARAINRMDDPKAMNIHAGILGKNAEYCLRFAGLLAIADLSYEGRPFATHVTLEKDHIDRAIKLAEYFYQSAWDVYTGVDRSVTAPMEVLKWAGYMRAFPRMSFAKIGQMEFPRMKPDASRKKASRIMKKYIADYPKIFGAEAK